MIHFTMRLKFDRVAPGAAGKGRHRGVVTSGPGPALPAHRLGNARRATPPVN